MKISLSWLKDFVDINSLSAEQICKTLTLSGLETGGISTFNPVNNCNELIIGEIVDCWQHPNADKLRCTLVDIGAEEKLNIVCGAPNARKGIRVVVAPVNTTLITFSGEKFKIKKSKIRGEVSEGMLCAEDEIGLSNNHEQIIELDTNLPNGSSLKEIYKDQEVIEIDITPNRADACSHLGVARDLKAVKNLFLKFPELHNFKDVITNPKFVNIEENCKRFSTVTIKNIVVKESPDWIKERLRAVGMRAINNIVDITNYVMMELGQPLHAYDLSTIEGENIFIRKAHNGENFLDLKNKNHVLTENDLVITDKEKVLSLAGVIGGLTSRVKDDTTDVMFESACFNSTSVRKTSKKLSLQSESSYRFERGTDPCMTLTALQRVCFLLKQQQPDVVIENVTDSVVGNLEFRKIYCNYEYIDRLIGMSIPHDVIADILTRLDINVENVSHEGFTTLVPLYRVDVCRKADIVEEILRTYGYDNIIEDENLNIVFFKDQFKNVSKSHLIKCKISDILSARGFLEIFTNPLTSTENTGDDKITLLNSVSSKLNAMRTSMIPSLLEIINYNFNHDQKVVKIFEIGKTYHREENNICEVEHCACAIANKKQQIFSFFDLKNEIHNVLKSLDFNNFDEKLEDDGIGIFIGEEKICTVKKISHPDYEIFYADIILGKLPELQASVFSEISKFPSVIRDLSLVIDKNVTYQDIKNVIKEFNSEFIKDYKVVDTYEKEGSNKKTYTLSFTLNSLKGTLNDKIIQTTISNLIAKFENKIQAQILV